MKGRLTSYTACQECGTPWGARGNGSRHTGQGYCRRCHQRLRRAGLLPDAPSLPMPERFWINVRRGEPDDCWDWTGPPTPKGYGIFFVDGVGVRRTHRVAFYLTYGRWPMPCALHTCDRPACCNPAHIYEGTNADNVRDRVERGRSRGGRLAGEAHASAKLTAELVVAARQRLAGGEAYASIAAGMSVAPQTVWDAVHGRTWKHVKEGSDGR